ncbi:MAG: hypothetical protein LUC92_04265 [Clostridiales bacterium]|nr:hypothetical protein [Clostridiales bacterium]
MKKTYTRPTIEIVSFRTEEIAATTASSVQDTTAFGKLNVTANTVTY